jgi:predicted O-linked N-acetylglucosamine transferase (SPINDLY family)
MATVSEAMIIAIQQHQAGRLEDAESAYRQILKVEPQHADAWHLLGVIRSQTGDHARAVEFISRALEMKPDWAEANYNLGNAWRGQLKSDESIACYRLALELKPDYAEAHVNLGNALKDQGDLEGAEVCYRRALELMPDLAVVHSNLGNVLQEQGKPDAAVECYRRALALQPDFAEAHNNLGQALQNQGNVDEAVASCRKALELNPQFTAALVNLGNALLDQCKLDEAVACYHRALELQPGLAAGHNNLGKALSLLGNLNEAVACCRRALELKPDYVEAHYNLGNVLLTQAKLDEAVASYGRVLELKPDHVKAHNNLGTAWKDQGILDQALASYRRALELKPDYASAHSNLLYTLHYCSGVTPESLAVAHATYDRQHAAPLREAVRLHVNTRDGDRRLRLGFVSPDLGRHPVGYFLVRVLENLRPERHTTICYSDRRVKDDLTMRLKHAATDWRDVAGSSDERLAEQIRADRIDILFDLTGHSGYNRLLVFARKPAPIQITWIGYEGTTGLEAMDYLLADRHVAPEGSEHFFCERVLRMPEGYLCYDPPAAAPAVGPLPALRTGCVTFASFHNPAKITPEVVAVWAKILKAAPTARLMMKYRGLGGAVIKQRFLALFAAQGVDPGRLELLPWSTYADYLATHQQVDLALDPIQFSGSTVTCESLWMGVPVLTCPGATFASRHSMSHLSNVGLTETIARNWSEYVDLAVAWAGRLSRLADLRSELRNRMAASPLCDGTRFASNLSSLLHEVWENHTRRMPAAEQIDRPNPAGDWRDAEEWHRLGVAAYQHGNHQAAAEHIGRAIALRPDQAIFHSNLGNVLKDLGQPDNAVASYERALELNPDLALVHNNLAVALSAQGNLDDAIGSYRRALELNPDLVQAHSNLLYSLNFCPGYDARSVYEEHRRWDQRYAEPLAKSIQYHVQDRSPHRRLRVGYVSPDFRQHPVGLFMLPILARHDPENFEIYCYSSVARPDEITENCCAHAQVWRSVVGQSDEEVAQAIRHDQIDILVDLTMHMPGNRLLVFARKPAPVQVTYLAYCGTTGLSTIDYRLTDPYLDPPDGCDRWYSEESIRLPETYWCFPERGDDPAVGPLPAETAGHVTFGCLNNFCKVTAPTLDAWVRLLVEMPSARLLLHAHTGRHRDRLREQLAQQGVAADRLDFVGYLPTAEYLRAYNRIDIALDPFPLGGGTTTCDALWMGVPVVTLAGEAAVGRGGLSILSNVGLTELVARDVSGYVKIACDLARDKVRLADLRGGLRNQMRKSPLMNARRFTQNVEAAYRQMWQRWCAKGL